MPIKTVFNILTYFSRISRQKINTTKSKLFFSPNLHTKTKNQIMSTLGMLATNTLGTYLGFPLINTRITSNTFNFLVEKIRFKLNCWENKFLSPAGKAILIKTTISSIPIHIMQFLKLLDKTLKLIDKTSRGFLWGSKTNCMKNHLVNWTQVCKPLDDGGLGIPNSKFRNLSLLMSLAWRLKTNNKHMLWAKILPEKYEQRVMIGWELCNEGSSYLIGDDLNTSLWYNT